MENLKELLSDENIKKHKEILAVIIIAVLMTVGVAFLTGQLIKSYKAAEAVKAEKIKMTQEMKKFLDQKRILESQKLKPVAIGKVDGIQSQIVTRLTGSGLNLLNYKATKKENIAKDKFAAYEIHFNGSYESSMAFLKDFGIPGVLINTRMLEMTQKNGLVETKLAYRIYIN